jgi:hypothetical protein
MIEEENTSETPVNFYQMTRHNIPEVSYLYKGYAYTKRLSEKDFILCAEGEEMASPVSYLRSYVITEIP